MWRITVLFFIATTCSQAIAQSWSYKGNASCYHYGDTVQCFERGTLQRYASSREQFEAQFKAGQVVGEGIGALIRAWMEHRRKLEVERKDIRQQISAYYDATFELNEEVMRQQDALATAYTRLAQFDPMRRAIYEQGAKDSEAFNSRLAMLRPTTEKNLPGILGAKNLKYLRENLDLAKKFYNLTLDGAKKEYVYTQLMQALVGNYEYQQNAPEPRLSAAALTDKERRPGGSEVTQLTAAAEAGDTQAQATLGQMYRDGRGVTQSYAVAAKWLQQAADHGDRDSQLALGELFEEGRGVVQDFVRGHMWFNLAAAAGVPGAEGRRNSLAARMTPEQLGEAQKLAAAWEPAGRSK